MNVAKMLDLDDLLHDLENIVSRVAHREDQNVGFYDENYWMGYLSGLFRAIDEVERRLAIEKKNESQKGQPNFHENGKTYASDQHDVRNS